MIRRWLALTYYLYALRLAALPHFYFNPLLTVSIGMIVPSACWPGFERRFQVACFN